MWFAARLIVKCSLEQNQNEGFLFDELIKIIEAKNREDAYEKALKLGIEENHEYKNSKGELVKWNFEGLFDLNSIEVLEDGAEISSKRFRADSSEAFIVPKEKLSIFFEDKLKGKTAKQILDEIDE